MRTGLRVAGFFVGLVVVAFWFFGGAHLGWTKTSVPHTEKDPVTELEVQKYEKHFEPGVDFLGAGLAAAVGMAVVSFAFRRQN